MPMEQQYYDLANQAYINTINIIGTLAETFKKVKKLGDEWKVDVFLRQFDVILQYSLLEVATLDHRIHPLEIDFIKNLTKFGDFVEYIKATYETDFDWEYLKDNKPELVRTMLDNERKEMIKFARDFVGIVSAFNAISKEDFPEMISQNIVRICSSLVFSDNNASETPEAVSHCLIFGLINAIKDETDSMKNSVKDGAMKND